MTIKTRLVHAAMVTAAAALALGPAAALAQQGTSGMPGQNEAPSQTEAPTESQPQTEGQTQVSDEELKTYVNATVKLQEVNDKWQQRYQATADTEERVDLQQQAQAEMVRTVESEGLSVGQYNTISQAVQRDPELQARATAFMQERIQPSAGSSE